MLMQEHFAGFVGPFRLCGERIGLPDYEFLKGKHLSGEDVYASISGQERPGFVAKCKNATRFETDHGDALFGPRIQGVHGLPYLFARLLQKSLGEHGATATECFRCYVYDEAGAS